MEFLFTPTWQGSGLPGDLVNFLNGFTLLGIPAVVLIPVLIELAKRGFGVPTHWSIALSIGLSALVFALIGAIRVWPQVEYWVTLLVAALVLGLASPGTYSQFKLFTKGNPTHPGETGQAVGAPSDNKNETDFP